MIGKTVLFRDYTLKFEVEILDVKMAWGKFRFQVTPINGIGTVWKDEESLEEV